MDKISIIVPILNEAGVLGASLAALKPLRMAGHEVIVVDGGSADDSTVLAEKFADRVILAPRGRARQMNIGAALATGEILLFLHADTFLPHSADVFIRSGLETWGRQWGHFDVRLSGKAPLLRVVERAMNLRSRLTGIATGDQAIFVLRALFKEVGGFPDLDLMEDVALSARLKRRGPPLCLKSPVETSSRRWERDGILRTIFLMWSLRLAFAIGVRPARLAKFYR